MIRTWMGLLFVLSSAAFPVAGADLGPVFQVGHPSRQPFSTWAYGYGALTHDREHVAAYFPGGASAHIRTGLQTKIRLGTSESEIPGTVTDVLPEADPGTGQSIVTLRVAPQDLPARTYATVRIKLSSREALAVPTDAVVMEDGNPYVYKRDGKGDFDKVAVTIGEQSPSYTEIRHGLDVSDTVLVEGALEWEAQASGASEEGD